jgi:cyclohexyl-isocyanide hydratase
MGDPRRTYPDFLIRQAAQTPLVASVCEGALLLAAAGLLDGYEATTHWAFIPCLKERFPKVTVVEGHPASTGIATGSPAAGFRPGWTKP